MKFDMKTHLFV